MKSTPCPFCTGQICAKHQPVTPDPKDALDRIEKVIRECADRIVAPIAQNAVERSLVERLPDAMLAAVQAVNDAPIDVRVHILRQHEKSSPLPVRATEGASGYDLFYTPPERGVDGAGNTRAFSALDVRPHPNHAQPGVSVDSKRSVTLYAGTSTLLPTGIALAIPPGFEAQIRPRSGLACKGIMVQNSPGTIDSDYRGEVKVLLTALNNKEPITIHAGDRIAQLVFATSVAADLEEVASLDASDRAEGGFGSTGK